MRSLIAGLLLVSVTRATAMPLRLSDGTEVVVANTGAFVVRDDGRDLLASADGAALTLRHFDDVVTPSFTGLWTFSRQNVETIPLSDFRVARRAKGSVRIKLKSPRVGGGKRHRATIEFTPVVPSEVTRITVTTRSPRGFVPTSLALPVRCDAQGSFHGFGEQYNATDQRGEAFPLFVSEQGLGRNPALPPFLTNGTTHTTYFPMPYYLDGRGFGVLVETDRRVDVDVCKTDASTAWLETLDGGTISLLLFHGPTPLDVIRQLGDQVGRPKAPPAWAYSLWMSAQGGRAAVRAKADALLAADVPVGVIWSQDWTGVRVNFDGGLGVQYRWQPDLTHYPDLPGFADELHADGLRFLAYANPFVASNLPNHFPDMAAQGLLIRKPDGTTYTHIAPNGISSHPDLTNPAAREYVKAALRAMVTDYHFDGWMSDFGEWLPTDAVYEDGSDPIAMHNRYPIEWHRLWREVMDELHPDGDYVVFARSGWTGVQAVSMIHWVGDQETDWSPHDGLPTVVPAMLNLGLAGIPFVTHDIAGFSGTIAPPSTKELFQRWVELGAFTPIMRTHDGADRNNNWRWDSDADTTSHFRRFARIHEALGPEIQALAAEAATTSAPIARDLMLVFPDDPASWSVHDQFMLGNDLLVAPVVTEGAITRDVYLPPGSTWYDVWTGTDYAGGQTVTVAAPIGSPPVFSRNADRADLRAIL